MVDALVLEASTSVCGFESHLRHQKKKGTERCLFLLVPCCDGDFRFAPCVAGTCGSPTHAPSLFCDTIQFGIETDRSCHRPGPGAELRSGLFSLPPICAPVPADLNLPGSKKPPGDAFFWLVPPASPRQPFPNPCRRAAHQSSSLFSILSSLAPLRPSPPTSREGQRTALRRGGGSVPWQQCGTAKRPFPRTAPPAGHRLILNPVPQSGTPKLFTLHYSLFPLHSPNPVSFSLRSGQQNKNIFCFLVT